MDGRYRVFSIDRATWVDVEFTEGRVLVSSNTKKITVLPQEPLDTYLRRINEKMNTQGNQISVLKDRIREIDEQVLHILTGSLASLARDVKMLKEKAVEEQND